MYRDFIIPGRFSLKMKKRERRKWMWEFPEEVVRGSITGDTGGGRRGTEMCFFLLRFIA